MAASLPCGGGELNHSRSTCRRCAAQSMSTEAPTPRGPFPPRRGSLCLDWPEGGSRGWRTPGRSPTRAHAPIAQHTATTPKRALRDKNETDCAPLRRDNQPSHPWINTGRANRDAPWSWPWSAARRCGRCRGTRTANHRARPRAIAETPLRRLGPVRKTSCEKRAGRASSQPSL